MHKHTHECWRYHTACEHDCLHYCKKCGKVYCCKCSQEWENSIYVYGGTTTTTWPSTITADATGNDLELYTTATSCAHSH